MRETINARRIETFLFPDDLSLSGLQMVERVKSFLRYFAAYWPDRSPTVIIMVPIATNRLREYLFSDCSHTDYDICERRGCTLLHRALVQIISTHSILTVGDRLRRDGYSVERIPERLIEIVHADADSSWVMPLDATLMYAGHKIPDRWSLGTEFAELFGAALSEPPYRRQGAAYYKTETIEYERQRSLMTELPPGEQLIVRTGIN